MHAVFNALKCFRPSLVNHSVVIKCDNTSVVSYINREGGTHSANLCLLTWDLLQWCIDSKITLSAIHVPGVTNVIADALSRGTIRPTEWSLLPSVAALIFTRLDRPHVDLFASDQNNQLPVFCSRLPCHKAWQTDALSIPWTGMFAYAFPPISLISRVITKVEQENCRVLLIAPFWPRQPWFMRLVRLLVRLPIMLPRRPDLLFQPGSKFLHPAPDDLHLTCWMLSRVPSEQQVFRQGLQPLPPTAVDLLLERSTTAEFDITTDGANGPLLIQPVRL